MIWYLVGINFLSFIIYGLDKYYAIKNKYRISEHHLFVLSILGGNIGAIVGMKCFHHKTRKLSFWIINILSFALWIIILFL